MPIDDNKLNILPNKIADLDDNITDGAQWLKEYFDGNALALQGKLNAFVDFMGNSSAADSAAASVGSAAIPDIEGTNVRKQILSLKDRIDNAVNGQIPNGTITADKIVDGTISAEKISDGAVTGAKIAANSVSGGHLQAGAALDNLQNETIGQEKLQAVLQQCLFSVGDYKWNAKSSVIPGWLLCDGSEVSRAAYPALFSLIGATYGTTGTDTTFKLPDIKGRVLVGVDSSALNPQTEFDRVGKPGGEKAHSLNDGENGPHTHSVTTDESTPKYLGYPGGAQPGQCAYITSTSGGRSYTVYAQFSGNGAPHNNLQPYLTAYCFIKY